MDFFCTVAASLLTSVAPLPTVPQGEGRLQKLLQVKGVAKHLPARPRPSRSKSPVDVLRESGTRASELVANLLVPTKKEPPTPVDLMQQAIVLVDAKRARSPGGQVGRRAGGNLKTPRVRNLKDVETFFVDNHRSVRKAIGFDANFSESVPELHGFLQRMLADRDRALTKDERKMILRERKRAQKLDLPAMHQAALDIVVMAFAIAANKAVLARLPSRKSQEGVTGTVVLDKEFAFGRMVIGGFGRNVYTCSQIDVILDLGGDDEYRGAAGATHEERRYSVCIDFEGKDTYRGGSGALGSATYGLGALIDMDGVDDYEAGMRSAGFGAAGVGLFLDVKGDDTAKLGAHSGGVGLFGMGLCFDMEGDDKQRGAEASFGIGLTAGFGHFVDVAGNDQRHLVGADGKASLGLGAARGLGADLPGGFGVCIDHAGDDTYTGGELALGVADGGGLGVCIDLAGDDSYIAGGLSLGGARAHGVGVMLDVDGKDHYFAVESLAVAGPTGTAFFEDRGAGDDIFEVSGVGMGRASKDGMAFFEDLGGKNQFRFKPGKLTFLPLEPGGFSMFRALGSGDTYAPTAKDPTPKGQKIATKAHFELRLRN